VGRGASLRDRACAPAGLSRKASQAMPLVPSAAKLSDLKESRDDLERRIDALTADSAPIREQLANLDRQRDKLRNELAGVKQRIAALSEKPRVSDHAVIRYLERRFDFDFEHVRQELLTPTVLAAMDSGIEGVKALGGTLKLKGRTVVTYVD
jgi:predicted nuclease with TOPRIM domain